MPTYSSLSAIFINCSIKKNSKKSHTQTLIDHSAEIMEGQGVSVDKVYALDHEIPFGMDTDMTTHGYERDDWPALQKRVMDADILVLGSPIWLGVKSSVCTMVVERLYANSSLTNEQGQWAYYGKVGGCLVTGNEDGVKAVSMEILYAMQHIGYSIPPQADAGWIGEAGPGASYGDVLDERDVPVGFDNDFTNRNTTFMTHNLLHLAHMLKSNGGFPAGGNQPEKWKQGERFGHPLNSDGKRTDK